MIYAVLAVTVDLLWGFAGILTFGQAAFFGVGAYATAMLLSAQGGAPHWMAAAVALAVLAPLLLGLAVGWLSFYHRSTPLYASVISLVVPIVVTQASIPGLSGPAPAAASSASTCCRSRSRASSVSRPSSSSPSRWRPGSWCARMPGGCSWPCGTTRRAAPISASIRGASRSASRRSWPGVAGLAGFVFANASGVVAPENAGFLFGTELVIWVALGGRGTLIGPVLGTVAIDYLAANLSGELPFLWQLLLGTAFVAIIILLPGGLAEVARRAVSALPLGRRPVAAPRLAARPARPAPRTGAPILAVEGLAKSYGSLTVLESIDLTIRAGELVSLVGPNGAGKTTLMRCLSDGTEPFRGGIAIAGTATAA